MPRPSGKARKRKYVPTCACGLHLRFALDAAYQPIPGSGVCPAGCKRPELRAPHIRRRRADSRERERVRLARYRNLDI